MVHHAGVPAIFSLQFIFQAWLLAFENSINQDHLFFQTEQSVHQSQATKSGSVRRQINESMSPQQQQSSDIIVCAAVI